MTRQGSLRLQGVLGQSIHTVTVMINVPLMVLNTWSPVGGIACELMEPLGNGALLDEIHHWRREQLCVFTVSSHFLFRRSTSCLHLTVSTVGSHTPHMSVA